MAVEEQLIGVMGSNPLDDIPSGTWAKLSPEQQELLTLRFTTLMPRHVIAAKVGMGTSTMVAQENRALRIVSLPVDVESELEEAGTPTLDVSALSPDCQDLHANIGSKALLALIDKFGGSRMHIPLYVTDDHRLALLLGMESFKTLSAYCGGELVYIPKLARSGQRVRDRQIMNKYVAGQKVISIAMESGLTERRVYDIIARGRRKSLGKS